MSNTAGQILFGGGSAAPMQGGHQAKGKQFGALFAQAAPNQIGQDTKAPPKDVLTQLQSQVEELKARLAALIPTEGEAAAAPASLDAIAQEIGDMLAEFEAATGLPLTDMLAGLYQEGPSVEQTDLSAEGLSSLLTLLDLTAVIGQRAIVAQAGLAEQATSGQATAQQLLPSQAPQSGQQPAAQPVIAFDRAAQQAQLQARTGQASVAVSQDSAVALQTEIAASATQTAAQPRAVLTQAGQASAEAEARSAELRMDAPLALGASNSGTGADGGTSQQPFDFALAVAKSELAFAPAAAGFTLLDLSRSFDGLAQDGLGLGPAASEAGLTPPKAEAPSAAPQSKFASAIAEQLRQAQVQDGVTKIELSPRGLGTIEIEVATDADGLTSVVIRADNSSVLNALRDMRESLAPLINMESGGSLSFEDRPTGGDTDTDSNQGGFGASDGTGSEAGGLDGAAATAATVIDGRQLDITA